MLQKITILIGCFLLTLIFLIFIYQGTSPKTDKERIPLQQALKNIKGWQSGDSVPLDDRIIKALELDDYVNQSYSQGGKRIHLYIGYYRTNKKIGAAHDPLVCFPGQGWEVSETKEGKISLKGKPGEIKYSLMAAGKGDGKNLILYWFQVGDQASSNTFSQKVSAFWQKISKKSEANAFVRLSMNMGSRSIPECREDLIQFIHPFYPVFLEYMQG